jgi:hypothetical protein
MENDNKNMDGISHTMTTPIDVYRVEIIIKPRIDNDWTHVL